MTQSTKPASSDLPSLTTRMIVQNQFDLAADLIGLEDHLRRMLLMPFRVVAVEVPAQMDDGRIEVFRGYRVQHNAARGPCKGDSARVSAGATNNRACGNVRTCGTAICFISG